jgi:hypothetical protein
VSNGSQYRIVRLFVLAFPLVIAACGGDSDDGHPDVVGADDRTASASGPPDSLPDAAPVDLPVDLSDLPVRKPDPLDPPERPMVQGLAVGENQIVEMGVTNDSTVGFVGQSPARSNVELILNGEFIGMAMVRSDGTWVFDYQSVPLREGRHELSATSVRSDGRRSEAEEPFKFSYVPDAMPAPVIVGITPDTGTDDSDGITSASEVQLRGTATPNLPVVIYEDGTAIGSATADEDGNWQFDYPGTGLTDGVYSISAITELDGEVSATSATYTLRIDTQVSPPAIRVVNDSSGGNGSTNNPQVIVGGTTEPGSTVEIVRDGVPVGSVVADVNGDWQVTEDAGLGDGNYEYTGMVTDPAGNISEVSSALPVNVDTLAPPAPGNLTITPDSGTPGDGLTNTGDIVFSGTAEAGSRVRLQVDGESIGSVAVGTDGNWAATEYAFAFTDGDYQVTAISVDAAGNPSGGTTLNISIDEAIAAPSILGVSPDTAVDGDGVTQALAPAVGGLAEAGATVLVSVNGTEQTPAVVADASGNWSWDNGGTPLGEGSFTLSARAISEAGTESAASPSFALVIDATAPGTSQFSPANGATEIAVDTALSIRFDQRVFVSGGQLSVYRQSDDSLHQTVSLTDPVVSGSGTDTLNIELDSGNPLIGGAGYYVELDGAGITDRAGNSFAGIADTTTWTFTAAPTSIVGRYPANGATGISPTTGLILNFSEPVRPGAGDLRLYEAGGILVTTIGINDPDVSFLSDDTVVGVELPQVLEAGTGYYVELDAGAIENAGGVAFPGFSGSATWVFETAAGSVATVSSVGSTVPDGTYGTGAAIPVEVQFSEPVNVTDGTPSLTLQLEGETREVSYSAGSGTDTLVFEYPVQYGDTSDDLAYASVGALALNGARIRSGTFADSDLSLPVPSTAASLSGSKDLVIAGDSINADMPGDAGFVMPGVSTGGQLGRAVASAGDMNGDGFEDFTIAAPEAGNGTVYVIWGKDEGLPADITINPDGSLDAADGFRVLGRTAGDALGSSLAGGGDFNRDGLDDLVISAPGSDAAGTDNGAVYVVWGQSGSTRPDLDLAGLNHSAGSSNAAAMVILGSEAGQRLGGAVSGDGNGQLLALGQDFNGDGVHDLAIGHPGSDAAGTDAGLACLLFGETGASRANLSVGALGSDGILLSPVNSGGQLGQGIAFVGDFNADGYDDLAVGAPGDSEQAAGAGVAYAVFGSGQPQDRIVQAMSGSEGFSMTTATAGASLGYAVTGGDFNGDARPDLAIAAPGSGRAYVLYGYDAASYGDRNLDVLLASQGYALSSGAAGDEFGYALVSAGDFNADGADDLLVAAPLNDRAGADAGRAWLVKGTASDRPEWNLSSATSDSYVSITGGGAGDRLGLSVAAADFNGDGFNDLLLGVPDGDLGQALVIIGAGYGTTHVDGSSGTAAAERIVGGAGDDSVAGGGGADVISTGAGSDIIAVPGAGDFAKIRAGRGSPLTGMDVLRLDGSSQVLDLMALEPERINNVEMIDLGSGGNELHLDPLSLLGLSRETNQLYVIGDGSDTVTVEANGFWLEEGPETIGSYTYNKYVSNGAELFVDGLVNQAGISSFAGTQRYNLDTTSSGAGVSSDVQDFPVLLEITDASIIDATQPDGRDVRITGPDGSFLDYEIERWDQSADRAEVWVRMPVVHGNTNGANEADRNFLTLLYGGGAGLPDGQNAEGVWQAYSGVWHMNETVAGSEAGDATGLGNKASLESGSATPITGRVGIGRRLDAEGGMRVIYNASLDVSGNQPFTVSAWIDQRDPGTCLAFNTISPANLFYRGLSGTHWRLTGYGRGGICNLTSEGFRLNTTTIGGNAFDDWGSGSNPPWIMFTAVYDGSTLRYYQDGSLVGSGNVSGSVENGADIRFGAQDTGYDELRYGRFAMSAAEIRLMWYNQRQVTAGWFSDDRVLVTPAP